MSKLIAFLSFLTNSLYVVDKMYKLSHVAIIAKGDFLGVAFAPQERLCGFGALFCSVEDTHHKLLDRLVNAWCRFLTGGVFECEIAHRRSVAVLCMLYKISCNPMHPLYGALPGSYVPMRVTCFSLVSHRYT